MLFFQIPLGCNNFHHEIELGVIISKKCSRITKDQAMDHVGGYCLALDMTARDFQEYAKAKGKLCNFTKVLLQTMKK